MSSWSALLQGILPLLVFVIVDVFAGLKWGVIAAIVFAFGEVGLTYAMFGELDQTTVIAALLVTVLGWLSIKMNNPKFFKFQPVALSVLLAAILAYFQYFDVPLVLKYLDRHSVLVPAEMRAMMGDPLMRKRMGDVCGDFIYLLLAHAAIVAYAALRMSNVMWLIMRGVGFYLLVAVLCVIEIVRWM